jgi:hypothetical protein
MADRRRNLRMQFRGSSNGKAKALSEALPVKERRLVTGAVKGFLNVFNPFR